MITHPAETLSLVAFRPLIVANESLASIKTIFHCKIVPDSCSDAARVRVCPVVHLDTKVV